MKPLNELTRYAPLRRAVSLPGWADVFLRRGAALALVFIVVLVHWIDRDGLVDHHDGDVSFLDVVYFTMISITTTGFGDIAPISDRARLEDHIVVLGYGVSGSEAVNELIERGTDPACIVVIDAQGDRLELAAEIGCNVLEGDASRDDTLRAVRIDRARTVLVSAGRDDTTILIVLTVRHLAPSVPITAVVRAGDNELLARQAGSDNVINPVRFTGLLLAGSAQGRHISDYLADLASVSGKVQLVERMVLPAEVGRGLDELASGGKGLRIYRGGRAIGFWEEEARLLAAGDTIVEILPNAPHDHDDHDDASG